ncbi:MAG: PKD-like domain-containing protein, partial [Bacteroidota bacterium]
MLAHLCVAQTVTFNTARHQTISQREIVVNFTGAGGATGLQFNGGAPDLTDWTVQIDPDGAGASPFTTVTTTTVSISGFNVTVQFDATALNGYPFILPGQTMRISYSGGTGVGNVQVLPGGVNYAPAFTNQTSQNNYSATCSADIGFRALNTVGFPGQCAPVTTDWIAWTYEYSLRWRNSSLFVLGLNRATVTWNDGFGSSNFYQGYLSRPDGTADAAFYTTGVTGAFSGPAVYLSFKSPAAPAAGSFSYPDNQNICNYRAKIDIFDAGGAFNCLNNVNLTKLTQFDSYDFDDQNTGQLIYNPTVPNTDRVCLGSNVNMTFTDATDMNCNPVSAADFGTSANTAGPANNSIRWVRFIYGTLGTAPNGYIPDIRVGGVQVTHSTTGALLPPYNANPLLGGAPGYVPVGAGGPGVPDANGVIELSAPTNEPSGLLTELITTLSATNQVVGQRFYVTMQYWNICNRYSDGASPVETSTQYIEIIGKPVPLTTSGLTVCYNSTNSTAFDFTAVSSLGGLRTAVNWYSTYANVGTTTRMNNPGGANDLTFPAASYGSQGGVGGNFTINNVNGRYHSVWATQVQGGPNSCESDPVEIVILQQPRISTAPDIPNTPAGATAVCNNNSEIYTTNAPNTKTINANTSTNAAAINLPTENFWSVANYAAGVSLTPTVGNSTTVTFAMGTEPNPSDPGDVRVRRRYVTSTVIPVVSPVPAPFTVPTYNIVPQTCENANVNLGVTVFGASNGGTINGSPTICDGQSTGNLTATSTRGAILQWEYSYDDFGPGPATPYIAIGGTAGLTTINHTPPNGPGTYKYRVLVQNQNAGGPCPSVTTALANQNTVTVNPVPAQPTVTASGPTTFCFGGSVTLTASATDAATYRWYRNGVNTGVTTANIVLNTVAQSGTYTVEAVGVGSSFCVGPLSNPEVVTIHPLPTVTGPVGGGAVCAGNPAPDIVWTLTGTPPFNVTYTDGTSTFGPIVENTTTFSVLAPTTAGTYELTALTDATGCAATSLGGTASVTTGGFPPSVDPPGFTLDISSACDDGGSTANPVLQFSLNDANDGNLNNFTLRYTIDGGAVRIKNFNTNATGDPTGLDAPITFTDAELNNLAPSPHVIRIVSIVSLAGCQTTFNIDLNFTVNPRPATPVSNGNVVVCSDAIAAATVSVVAPGDGFTIDWYDAPTGGSLLLAGNAVFNPAPANEPLPTATATYYAETRNTTTGCQSSARVAVSLTSDLRPSDPTVGLPQVTCSDAAVLTGNVPDNGGTGTWTIGTAVYYESFSTAQDGLGITGPAVHPTLFTAPNGWSVTTPANNTFTAASEFIRVSGGAMVAQDVNSAEVVWRSPVIDISTSGTVYASARAAEFGTQAAGDYVRLYYRLDGGGEIQFGDITDDAIDNVFQTFSSPSVSGSTLQIVARIRNNAAGDLHKIDDVFIAAAGANIPLIADVNSPTSAVSNLQDGVNSFTWTITSALGACTLPTATLTITKNPQPATADINFDLCETIAGDLETLGYNLNVHNGAVAAGVVVDRAVTWFLDANFATPVPDATNVTVADNDVFYARVVNTLTGCTNETPILNAGSVTFNVTPLPATATLNPEVCENGLGTNEIDNVDLTTFNTAVAGGIGANRAVTWWLDPGVAVNNPGDLVTQIGTPTDVDDVNDAERFYAVVENTLTGCLNVGVVEYTILPLPFNNPIIPPGGGTPAGITVCASNTILLFQVDPALNTGSTYTWSIPTAPGEFVQFGGGGVNDFFVLLQFPNVTAPAGLDISVVETSADSCVGNVNTMNIRVDNSPPAPVITGDNNVCSGQENVVYSVPTNIGSVYTWNVPGTLGSIVSGQGTASITVNISTTSGVITVTETNSTGCISPPAAPFNVTVNNRPTMTSLNTVDLCSGEMVSALHTLTGSLLGTEFDWVVIGRIGPIGGASVGNTGSGSINQTLTNTSSSVGQIVYDVTPKVDIGGGEYCNGPTQTVTVDVHPEPVGQDAAIAVCSDVALVYDIQADNIDALGNGLPALFTYTVASSNAGAVPPEANRVAASNAPINHTYTNLTTANVTITYTITPVYDDPEACVGDPFILTVTVRPEPVGADDAVTVCGSDPVGYDLVANIAAGNNLTAGTTYSWVAADNPDVTGESTAPQVGNTISDVIVNQTLGDEVVVYTVTPISAAGCNGNPFAISVTVRPTPVGSNSTATVCSDVPVGVNLTTLGTAVAAATYNISVNANGLVQSGGTPSNANGLLFDAIADDEWRNTGLNPVNVVYTVTPVSAAGCEGPSFTVTVTVNPEPVVLSNTSVTRCSDQAVNVTLSSSVASVAAATYTIVTNANGLSQSGGTVSAGPAKAANELVDDVWRNTGLLPVDVEYTITPVSLAGCAGDPFTVTVTVNPEPVGANDTDIVCSDEVLNYTLTTAGASVAAATYNIVVNPNGLIQSGGTGSAGNNKLANELEDDVWRNIGLNPVNVEYTVTPVSAAGCQGDPFTVTITVRPEPVANNSAVTVCSDSPVGVTLTTLGTAVAASTYNIVVNNGGLSQSGGVASAGVGMPANALADDEWENTGLNPVNVVYTVTPVSAAGCAGDAFTVTVTVNPEPVGVDAAFVRCSDQAVGVNLTTNVGSVAATSYNIVVDPNGLTLSAGTASAGNGRAASEISDDVWRNTGLADVVVTYTVTPVSAAGCEGDPFDIEITVRPEPVGVNSTAIRCSDEVVGITLTTNGGSVAADTYTIAVAPNGLVLSGGTPSAGALKAANEIADDVWRNTGLNPVDVVYTITPVSADGCAGDPFTRTVTVRPEPVGAPSTLTRCSDQAVGVNLTTSGLAVAAATYDIVVTDNGLTLSAGTASGGTGQAANEIADDVWRNLTNGSVNVIYTVTPVSADGCEGDAFTVTVTVDPEPVLSAALDDAVCSDQIVDLVLANAGGSVAASGYNITNRVVDGGLTPVSQVTVPTNGVAANYLRNEIYRNTTSGNLDVAYTIVPVGSINGCNGDPVVVTITIQPEPVISPLLDRTVCSDAIVNLTLATNGASVNALDYNVVNRTVAPGLVPVAQVGVPANNVAANYLQNEIYRNTTNAALTVQYEVQATGTIGGCLGDTRIVVVTINPEPVIATTLDANRCSDATVGLMLNTNGVSVGALNYDVVSRTVQGGLAPINQVAVPANGVAANYL